jgi:hypothetical protein
MDMLPGGLGSLMSQMNPGGGPADSNARLKRFMVIMDSMTDGELDGRVPAFEESRLLRIARGSGTHPQEVVALLDTYKQFEKMIDGMNKGGLLKGGDAAFQSKMARNPNAVLQQMQKSMDPRMLKNMGGMQNLASMMKGLAKGAWRPRGRLAGAAAAAAVGIVWTGATSRSTSHASPAPPPPPPSSCRPPPHRRRHGRPHEEPGRRQDEGHDEGHGARLAWRAPGTTNLTLAIALRRARVRVRVPTCPLRWRGAPLCWRPRHVAAGTQGGSHVAFHVAFRSRHALCAAGGTSGTAAIPSATAQDTGRPARHHDADTPRSAKQA